MLETANRLPSGGVAYRVGGRPGPEAFRRRGRAELVDPEGTVGTTGRHAAAVGAEIQRPQVDLDRHLEGPFAAGQVPDHGVPIRTVFNRQGAAVGREAFDPFHRLAGTGQAQHLLTV